MPLGESKAVLVTKELCDGDMLEETVGVDSSVAEEDVDAQCDALPDGVSVAVLWSEADAGELAETEDEPREVALSDAESLAETDSESDAENEPDVEMLQEADWDGPPLELLLTDPVADALKDGETEADADALGRADALVESEAGVDALGRTETLVESEADADALR